MAKFTASLSDASARLSVGGMQRPEAASTSTRRTGDIENVVVEQRLQLGRRNRFEASSPRLEPELDPLYARVGIGVDHGKSELTAHPKHRDILRHDFPEKFDNAFGTSIFNEGLH